MDDYVPVHFIGEEITVRFDQPPMLEKKPSCPDAFIWRDAVYAIRAVLSEWVDFKRRGRMARNMQPQHAVVAEGRGSWGVGRFYFQVEVDSGRIFQIYYDRAPKDSDERKGQWVLVAEYTQKQS